MSERKDIPKQKGDTPLPASPASTGGEGTFFEQHVGASFLGLLLTRGVSPCFTDAYVSEVRFQTKNDGWHTDDILVKVMTAEGTLRNLALQVKLELTITASKSNTECREVISGAWRDFNNSLLFSTERDLLGFVVSRGTQALLRDFRSLLTCAEASRTADLFSQRIAAEGYVSNKSRDQYEAICLIIRDTEPSEVQDSEIWQFLRSLRLLAFDFDPSTRQAEAQTMSLLAMLTDEADPMGAARATWLELLRISGEGMPSAAAYTYDDLPLELKERHRSGASQERGPVRPLLDHTDMVLSRISAVIGDGTSIDRSGLVSAVLQGLDSSNLVVVTGPAGSGKSAVARNAFDALTEQAYLFAFRAEEFATAHFDDTLNRAQVPFQATNLFRLLGSHDRKIVLVESVERLLEKPDRDAFADLLRLIHDDSSWQLVLTCRQYSLDVFHSAFLEQAGMPYVVVPIPPLDDPELETVAKSLPLLRRPLANQRLRELLRNPYLLAMAAKMSWPEPGSLPGDEQAFRLKVWKEVVKKESYEQENLPTRRSETFKMLAIRRARALVPFAACDDLDGEALKALRSDGLIEYSAESDLIAAPAHDVLEDWAILQWIDDKYALSNGDYGLFLAELGPHPAIRRAYRQWLSTFLQTKPSSALALVIGISFDDNVPSQTRDDTLVSLMLSECASDCLRQSMENIIADEYRLLLRLIHLLRVACMASPSWLSGYRGAAVGAFLQPKGASWPVVLEFVADNLDGLLPGNDQILLGLVKDWAKSVSVDTPNPDGAGHCGAIAHRLLAHYEEGGYSFEEQTKDTLEVILKIPAACEREFLVLMERACRDDRGDHVADRISKMLLEDTHSAFACRDFPDEVMRLADARWKPKPAKHGRSYDYYGRTGLADVFGLSPHVELGYFPASAWSGPFIALLRYHPDKGLAFIIDLINHSVHSYATCKKGIIEAPLEVSLSLTDEKTTEQWCNDRLWCLHRGSSVGPYLLQSALMALEAWLLEECEQGHDVLPVLESILERANNAALSAVVASIAMAHPLTAGTSALALIRCRDFVQLDLVRMTKDYSPVTASLNTVFPTLPAHRPYNEERVKSDSLPHRRSQLEHLAVELQTGPLRDETQRIIDEHYRLLPPLETQGEEDKLWRLALHRMDFRNYELKGRLDDGRVVVQAGTPEPDLEKVVEQNIHDQLPMQEGSRLLNWGASVFRGDENSESKLACPQFMVQPE